MDTVRGTAVTALETKPLQTPAAQAQANTSVSASVRARLPTPGQG